MQLIPLYEKVVVKILDKQEIKSDTGIVIQKNMSQATNTTMVGEVISVGNGRLMQDGTVVPLRVKSGDKILFTKMSGESYNDGSEDLILLSESSILAIIEGE